MAHVKMRHRIFPSYIKIITVILISSSRYEAYSASDNDKTSHQDQKVNLLPIAGDKAITNETFREIEENPNHNPNYQEISHPHHHHNHQHRDREKELKLPVDKDLSRGRHNHHASKSSFAGMNDIQGRIYSSLVKILHSMKQQMDTRGHSDQQRMDLNLDKTDVNQDRGFGDGLYNNNFGDITKTTTSTNGRDKSRNLRDVEYKYPPASDSNSNNRNQLSAVEIFNDMSITNGQSSTVDGDETKFGGSRSRYPVTYSNYLGPTPDSNNQNERKPTSSGSTNLHAIHTSAGSFQAPRSPHSWSTFSPKFEGTSSSSLSPKSLGLIDNESDALDKPLFSFSPSDGLKPRPEPFYTSGQTTKSTTTDIQVDQQPLSASGFSPSFNGDFVSQSPLTSNDSEESGLGIQDVSFQTTRRPKMKSHNNAYGATKRHRPKQRGGSMNQKYLQASDYYSGADFDSHVEQMEDEGTRATKLSPLIGDTTQDQTRSTKTNQNSVFLHQVYPQQQAQTTTQTHQQQHQPQQSQQIHFMTPAQQQQIYYSLASMPQFQLKSTSTGRANVGQLIGSGTSGLTFDASASNVMGQQPQRDLLHQPQTIQITAVPNLGFNNNPSLVRVNGGLGNMLTNGVNGINGWLDPLGRQVLMVSAERRQIDWSFLIWPILLVVALPLILSALFVPVFLKSIVILIQILQSLGLVLPISGTIGQLYKATTGGANNATTLM